jgi:SnoaL-like polyketide cyclase
MSDKTQILGNWYRRVWEEEDAGAIDKLFVPDSDIRQIGMSKPIDLEEFKGFHKLFCDQLQNIDIHIDMAIEQGDWLAALCSCYAKNSRTGENVTITGNVMVKITDGKLRGCYEHWDFMGLWDQLGLLPDESFQKCLQGQKLA